MENTGVVKRVEGLPRIATDPREKIQQLGARIEEKEAEKKRLMQTDTDSNGRNIEGTDEYYEKLGDLGQEIKDLKRQRMILKVGVMNQPGSDRDLSDVDYDALSDEEVEEIFEAVVIELGKQRRHINWNDQTSMPYSDLIEQLENLGQRVVEPKQDGHHCVHFKTADNKALEISAVELEDGSTRFIQRIRNFDPEQLKDLWDLSEHLGIGNSLEEVTH
ncbi:MAG: hypothetical protein FWC53_00735 [Firmicutes bacterium]|nr:hypothetical protein [Bacillota bacterium]